MGDQPTGERQVRNAQASMVMGWNRIRGQRSVDPCHRRVRSASNALGKSGKWQNCFLSFHWLTFVRVLGAVKDENKHKDARKNEVNLDPGVITFTASHQLPKLWHHVYPALIDASFFETKSNLYFWFHCSRKCVIFGRWSTASTGFACARGTPTLHDLACSHVNSRHGLIGCYI